jgi:hypothetical protein
MWSKVPLVMRPIAVGRSKYLSEKASATMPIKCFSDWRSDCDVLGLK